MPDGTDTFDIAVYDSLDALQREHWDNCAGTTNPFVLHGFLSSLEESGSVTAETGWHPQHLAVSGPDGGLLGAVPLYVKNHSYGEYVFDWSWADAYHRAGGQYYPKLQCAVPFTPVTGPRLLMAPGAPDNTERLLMAGMLTMAEKLQVSSLHVTFPTEREWRGLGDKGFLQREGIQYHWENRGYANFDGFLAALSSRKRKAIRKERRLVAEQGITMRVLEGADITEAHWDAFYTFYRDTVDKKWGSAYLRRSFFSLLGERLADNIVLIIAEDQNRIVAGALNLRGGDTLFGRNWGCIADYKFLHFETCYYQAIDYAIQNGLKWVEAGAQGAHKVQRGYLPRKTYSAHWFADGGFSTAIARYLEQERAAIDEEFTETLGQSPYRQA